MTTATKNKKYDAGIFAGNDEVEKVLTKWL